MEKEIQMGPSLRGMLACFVVLFVFCCTLNIGIKKQNKNYLEEEEEE